MSHNITLHCGCLVYVSCHPQTGIAHTRVIRRRSHLCSVRTHDVGVHLAASELPTDPSGQRSPILLHLAARRIPA